MTKPATRVTFIHYGNPASYPSLEHAAKILSETGIAVTFLGGGSPVRTPFRMPDMTNVSHVEAMWSPNPTIGYVDFARRVVSHILRQRPNLVYVSDPKSCPVGSAASRILGSRVIYHEHDVPSPASTRRQILRSRARLLRRADAVVVPNEKRGDLIKQEYPEAKVAVVPNCPSVHEVSGQRTAWTRPKLTLLYHGSIVPDRLPPTVIEALSLLGEEVRLKIVGYETQGHPGYVEELETRAAQLGLTSRVEYLGALPFRSGLLEVAKGCDVGLALMPKIHHDVNMQTMAGASNKPFDYLACGVPVIVSELPGWTEMYASPGYGLSCDPSRPEDIAAAVTRFQSDPSVMRDMGEAGRQRILKEWNYERQFAPVLDVIARASD